MKEDGSNEWVFESLGASAELSSLDSQIFWTALYVTPLVWGFFLIIGLLKFNFEYLPVILAAIAMSSANIIGYMKCSTDQKNRMKSMVEKGSNLAGSTFSAFENSSVRNFIVSSVFAMTNNNNNNDQKRSPNV